MKSYMLIMLWGGAGLVNSIQSGSGHRVLKHTCIGHKRDKGAEKPIPPNDNTMEELRRGFRLCYPTKTRMEKFKFTNKVSIAL